MSSSGATKTSANILSAASGSFSLSGSASVMVTNPPPPPLSIAFIISLEKGGDGEVIKLVAPAWGALLAEIARDPDALLRMTPRQFEELVAAAHDADGADEVVLTPRSGDRGRDVIATYKGFGSVRILDQAKQFASDRPVPADDVRALLGVLALDLNASKAVLTTTSHFAPGVADEFKAVVPYRLELVNGAQLTARLAELAKK